MFGLGAGISAFVGRGKKEVLAPEAETVSEVESAEGQISEGSSQRIIDELGGALEVSEEAAKQPSVEGSGPSSKAAQTQASGSKKARVIRP